jgi:ficolin
MKNGGWTVIQRRQDGSENFYRPWNDYVNGFGNRTGEYWIGLENIYRLTLPSSKLRIEMETFGDVLPIRAYAEYTVFKVDSAGTKYRLTVNGFSGDCGNALGAYHSGRAFTTYDRDNDLSSVNCALKFQGAWWYNACHWSNLNGLYLRGKYTVVSTGMDWFQCWGHNYSVKTSMIKIQRIV